MATKLSHTQNSSKKTTNNNSIIIFSSEQNRKLVLSSRCSKRISFKQLPANLPVAMNAFGLFVIRLDLWHIPRNIASKLKPLQEPVAMMIGSEWHPADHTKANLLVVGDARKSGRRSGKGGEAPQEFGTQSHYGAHICTYGGTLVSDVPMPMLKLRQQKCRNKLKLQPPNVHRQ